MSSGTGLRFPARFLQANLFYDVLPINSDRYASMTTQKHLLITISDNTENLFGVRFVRSFFNDLAPHLITLLHINRIDTHSMIPSLTEMWEDDEKPDGHQLTFKAKRAIENAKNVFKDSSLAIDQMIVKTATERYGKVKDILTEGAKGCYDAIVLGRRASYALQWIFERPANEIHQSMLREYRCTVPLWICPESDQTRRNVLLCVDGSASSLRAADHVGYILAPEAQHQITLFHVLSGRASRDDSQIFKEAETILTGHGIGADRIKRQTARGISVAGSIQSEGEKGQYAAVVLGMHGHNEPAKENKFFQTEGTVSKLINKIEKTALWCCP